MNPVDTCPEVACSVVEPVHRHDPTTLQVILCPYCGESHTHGIEDDWRQRGGPRNFGPRAAHCYAPAFSEKAGYILMWDGQTRGDQRGTESQHQMREAMGEDWMRAVYNNWRPGHRRRVRSWFHMLVVARERARKQRSGRSRAERLLG